MSIVSKSCLLCGSTHLSTVRRRYWHCLHCDFIFLDPSFRLMPVSEKERYLKHQNTATDSGYIQFLQKMVNQLKLESSALLFNDTKVLDCGSGPEPILAGLVRESGFQVEIYDPFFAADESVLSKSYDFILLNEVLEHFYDPLKELTFLLGLLKEGGKILVQTQFHQGPKRFVDWWYPRDPTHVSFFSKRSLCEGLPKVIFEKIVLVADSHL